MECSDYTYFAEIYTLHLWCVYETFTSNSSEYIKAIYAINVYEYVRLVRRTSKLFLGDACDIHNFT